MISGSDPMNGLYGKILQVDLGTNEIWDREYPEEVVLDLGENGRPEYRFGGYGSGQWGNQYYFTDTYKNPRTYAEIYPSEDGDTYYVKLPSNAVSVLPLSSNANTASAEMLSITS